MMRVAFVVSFLILIKITGLAQDADTTRYRLRYGLTGIYNRTVGANSFVINNALAFSISKKKISFNSNSSWIYGRNGDGLTNNDILSGVNFDILKDIQKVYYWGLANYTSSFSLKINYQFQGGFGLGLNVFNRPNLELVISDGIIFEASDLQQETTRDIYQTIRNSLRIKHRLLISDLVTLEGSHFWQPAFSNLDDYIIRSTTGLSLRLRKWLSITGAVTYNKVSRTNRDNLLINFGFVAENVFTGRIRSAQTPLPPAPVVPVE